jgi:hypothetical protein
VGLSRGIPEAEPGGAHPVLRDEGRGLTLVDSRAICEYLEETSDKNPMINGTAANRAEIRRLVALFDENFFADVTMPLLEERMKKRLVYRQSPIARPARGAAAGPRPPLLYRPPDRQSPVAGRFDDESGRPDRRRPAFRRRLSGRDRLERPRSGARLVRRVQEPPKLPPAALRTHGRDPAPTHYADVNA